MANRFRQQVSRTVMNCVRTKAAWLRASLLAAALSGVSRAFAQAPAAAEPLAMKPYPAEYTTTARGMSLTLTRALKSDGAGTYTLTNGGKILVVGFHEVAVFSLDGDQVKP